jgi:hypothetical protein
MIRLTILSAILLLAAGIGLWLIVKSRNMQYWIGAYWRGEWRAARALPAGETVHVYFCFADHYEPYGYGADKSLARQRVDRWLTEYPMIARKYRDSEGRHPIHSFFYPAEEYDAEILDDIAGLCRNGFGDVEVHLHHDNDNAANLEKTLNEFKTTLHERHGLLRRDPLTHDILYCFIHGNWALDNSRPDGRWCGVDNEIDVLVKTGCRCDMTMPSAPSDTQTNKINSIYFAQGHAGCRKSHDQGRYAAVGTWRTPEELLLIQGPLGLNWASRKFGLIPRIESAEISADAPPSAQRVALWEEFAPVVHGAPHHVFIKVHTHGAVEDTMDMLFGGGFETLWSALEARFRDRPGHKLHYVSAWQMAERVRELSGAKNA